MCRLLGNDVDVDRWGVPQETVDGGYVQVPLPSSCRGSAEYHVSKVLLVHYFGNSLSDRLSFHTNDGRADILGELDIGLQGFLIAFVVVLAAIDIDHVQLPIKRLRHPGAARN
jgi:hypothetical protein